MAQTYEQALEQAEVYGRPVKDIPFGEYIRGILTGETQVSETPPTITIEGKVFSVTPETVVRGLVLSERSDGRIPSSPVEAAKSMFLRDHWIGGCCVDDKSERMYVRAGAVACSGSVFGGFWIDSNGELIASKLCPSVVSDEDLPIRYSMQEKPSRDRGGIYIQPSVLSIEAARAMVEPIIPEKPKDFTVLIKDMLKNFVNVPKRQTYWSEEMNDGHSDNEPRDPRAQDILKTLGKMDLKNHKKLGDDYSVNKSVEIIVEKILEGKLKTFNAHYERTVVVGAQQLAATWAHLHASRVWAERTSISR